MFIDANIEYAVLRFAVLVGAMLSAGSVLFAMTHPQVATAVGSTLRRQVLFGVYLIVAAEPLRWFAYQLAISGGDAELALDPSMRWLAFDMPQGQAALVRIFGAVMVAVFWLRWLPLTVVGLTLLLGSFALEGHTASIANQSSWLSFVILVHLLAVSWWFGGLWPLAAAVKSLSDDKAARAVERFGRIAVGSFILLGLAGVITLVALTDGTINLENGYQRMIIAKLFVITAILALAAYNKLILTPGLKTSPQTLKRAFQVSIRFEIALAAVVLLLTGFLSTLSPGTQH